MEDTKTTFVPGVLEKFSSRAYRLTLIEETRGPESLRPPPSESSAWTIDRRVIRLGSHVDNEICLEDSTVSRFHAKIEVDVWGHRLIDEGSKNGVFVNGLRVLDVYLQDGVVIRLGGLRLAYQLINDQQIDHFLSPRTSFGALIGQSTVMRELFALLERVSSTDMTVLIEGPSGTGKELAAAAIHQHSSRHTTGPFVIFDCSAISPTLVESELFGHIKGAFTGADQTRQGAFSRAQGGTLFLDEIGELPLDLQPRLLRALERGEVKPVGGDVYTKADVRIIAATHRDLALDVEGGLFRLDLYYRIAVIKVTLPPLRYHPEDIPDLVNHFIQELSPEGAREVSYSTMTRLQEYEWRGNVRELKNLVARAVALSHPMSETLETRFLLPPSLQTDSAPTTSHAPPITLSDSLDRSELDSSGQLSPSPQRGDQRSDEEAILNWVSTDLAFKDAKARLIEQFEVAYWTRLLKETRENVSEAARRAGIHRKSAEYLLKKINLR